MEKRVGAIRCRWWYNISFFWSTSQFFQHSFVQTLESNVFLGGLGPEEIMEDQGTVGAELELEQVPLFASARRKRRTVGGTTCCVSGCYNSTSEDKGRMRFYRFLAESDAYRVWVSRLSRPQAWKPNQFARICSNHFLGGRRSKTNPHPVLFPPAKGSTVEQRWDQLSFTHQSPAAASPQSLSSSNSSSYPSPDVNLASEIRDQHAHPDSTR